MAASFDYVERLKKMIDLFLVQVNHPPRYRQLPLLFQNPPSPQSSRVSLAELSQRINVVLAGQVKNIIHYQSLHKWKVGDIAQEISAESAQKLGVYVGLNPAIAATAITYLLQTGECLKEEASNMLTLEAVLDWIQQEATLDEQAQVLEVIANLLRVDR